MKESRERFRRDLNGPCGQLRAIAAGADVPSSKRPRSAEPELDITSCVVFTRIAKTRTDPRSGIHGNSVANELPTRAALRYPLRRKGPFFLESLYPLSVAYIWFGDSARRKDDRGRGRDSDGRATFESRHRVDGPAEAPEAFGPVETAGDITKRASVAGLSTIIDKENGTWVVVARGENVDALGALRYAEGAAIYATVGPLVAEPFELGHDHIESPPAPQL